MSIRVEFSRYHGRRSGLAVCNVAYVCSMVIAASVFDAFCDQGPAVGQTVFWRRGRWYAVDTVVLVHSAIVARFMSGDNPVFALRSCHVMDTFEFSLQWSDGAVAGVGSVLTNS